MKHKILLIILAFSYISNAQNYDFRNYKYRVNGFKALSFNSNLRGASNADFGSYNFSNSNTLGLDFNFSRFKNTENRIMNINYGLTLNGEMNNSTYPNNSKYFGISNANFYLENYFYKKNHFKVHRAGANGHFSLSDRNPYQNIQKTKTGYLGANYEFGIGRGRLEYIADPVMANFILKDLKKKGVINSFTSEQVESFGKKISQILSIRMIDFRFRLIDQITMLDTFLKNQITDGNTNALFYTTLYDNWIYANRFQRFAGKRTEFVIGDGTNDYYNQYKHNPDSVEYSNRFYNTFFIGFQYSEEKPANLTLQKSRLIRFEIQKLNEIWNHNYPDHIHKSNSHQLTLYFSEALGWYPNTRTYVKTGINFYTKYNIPWSQTFTVGGQSYKTLGDYSINSTIQPFVNLFYFISPKIRIRANCNINCQYYTPFISSSSFNVSANYSGSLAYVFY